MRGHNLFFGEKILNHSCYPSVLFGTLTSKGDYFWFDIYIFCYRWLVFSGRTCPKVEQILLLKSSLLGGGNHLSGKQILSCLAISLSKMRCYHTPYTSAFSYNTDLWQLYGLIRLRCLSITIEIYSRTSMAQTLMARLPQLFQTHS